MARILDTTDAFEAFARRAFLKAPVERERLWGELYESAHPAVFKAFRASRGADERPDVAARELSRLRQQVGQAAPVMRDSIERVEPAVRQVLGLAAEPAPMHVLMVDGFSTSAVVGRMDGDVALFHCLEWFQSPEGAQVLVAHESAHAWHEMALREAPPADDLAWTAFSEGLAIRTSRAVVPDRPEQDYFWYGHPGFDDWLAWCRERRGRLLGRFRDALEEPDATAAFFGAGRIEDRLRVGFFVADDLVARLARPLSELVELTAADARVAVRGALDAG